MDIDMKHVQFKLDIETLDYTTHDKTRLGNLFRHIETQFHSNLYLSLLSQLKKHSCGVVFTMPGREGIPLAGLCHIVFNDNSPFVSIFT